MEDDLEKVKNASSQVELLDNIKAFGRNASELMNQAAKRQQELKDPQLRDDLAAARAVLKKHSTMLLTASKVRSGFPCKFIHVPNIKLMTLLIFYLSILGVRSASRACCC